MADERYSFGWNAWSGTFIMGSGSGFYLSAEYQKCLDQQRRSDDYEEALKAIELYEKLLQEGIEDEK